MFCLPELRYLTYYEQTFVTLLQYFYKIDQESKDIIHKQYLLVWFFAFDVPIYVIYMVYSYSVFLS
jgi:hypothetical protein